MIEEVLRLQPLLTGEEGEKGGMANQKNERS